MGIQYDGFISKPPASLEKTLLIHFIFILIILMVTMPSAYQIAASPAAAGVLAHWARVDF
jgi:hypothetical protein